MLGRGVQFPRRIVHPAALHSSEQLLTPRAPPEQLRDTKCRITSCKAAIPSNLLGISQGIYPSSTSLQVSGEELVAHHHFCVVPGTDKPSQGIFHIPWSREFLGSGPSCSLSAPRFFIPFFHPESSLCVSVDVSVLTVLPVSHEPTVALQLCQMWLSHLHIAQKEVGFGRS